MNEQEHKKYLEDFKKFAKNVLKSKESAISFLVSAGINTKTGSLTERYTSETPKIGFKSKEI